MLLPQLADSYLACRAGSKAAIPDGFTCHAPGNSFHYSRQIPERIDYVLSSFECTRCEITLQMTPGGFSYSDHFAIHARLDLDGLATTTATEALPQAEVLKTSLQLLREGSAAAAAHARWRQRAAAAVAALGIACLLFAACGHSLAVALPAPHGPAAAKLLAAVDHRALYGAFGLLAKLLAVVAFVIWQIGFQANSTLSNTLLQATRRLEVLCRVTAGGGCAGGAAAAATNGNGTRHS